MCLKRLCEIPREEHFQEIRWKYCDPYGNKFVPLYLRRGRLYERGKLFIDDSTARINVKDDSSNVIDEYMAGVHVAIRRSNFPAKELPVLVSDIVAYGEDQDSRFGKTIVARMVYFLTKKEYEFLTTEHKPIQVNEDNFEVKV